MRVHLSILLDYIDLWAPNANLKNYVKQDMQFSGVQMLWPGQDFFREDVLYILPYGERIPRTEKKILFLTCDASVAAAHTDNVILIQCVQSPYQICDSLSHFLSKVQNWENGLNLGIISGKSAQEFVDESEWLLRNPVIVQDAQFCYLAGTSGVSELDEIYRKLKDGTDIDHEVVTRFIQNRQIITGIEYGRFPSGQSYHIAVGPTKKQYKEIYVDLQVEGTNAMVVHMCLCSIPVTEGLLRIFDVFCSRLLSAVCKKEGRQSQEFEAISDYVFGKLISNEDGAHELARSYGILPDQPYLVAAVCKDTTRSILKRINAAQSGCRAFFYEQQIFIYAPVDLNQQVLASDILPQEQQLRWWGEQYQLRLGVSGCFHSLKDMHNAVGQAQRTLALYEKLKEKELIKPQTIVSYRDIVYWDVIACYSAENPIESFAPPSYLRLLESDQKSNKNNCCIAESFIKNNCNISQTAKELFMHKNSVLYRIEQIKNLFGVTFSDEQENYRFLLACQARRLSEEDILPPKES